MLKACLLAAPAPVAKNSGTIPRQNAKEVIQIGLNLNLAASMEASNILFAFFKCSSIANSTINMAFLADKPISNNKPV